MNAGESEQFGGLLLKSHDSSRDTSHNSYPQLHELVEVAESDGRCVGARLSGVGFGGITIHPMRKKDANSYLEDINHALQSLDRGDRWSAICEIDDDVVLHTSSN